MDGPAVPARTKNCSYAKSDGWSSFLWPLKSHVIPNSSHLPPIPKGHESWLLDVPIFPSTPERISTYCGWPSSPRPQKIARMPKAMVDHHFSGPWSHMSDITNLYTERRLWRVELGALLGFFSLHFHLQPYQVYSLCHWICRYMGGILTLPKILKKIKTDFNFFSTPYLVFHLLRVWDCLALYWNSRKYPR